MEKELRKASDQEEAGRAGRGGAVRHRSEF
jgi:hypothetical protein